MTWLDQVAQLQISTSAVVKSPFRNLAGNPQRLAGTTGHRRMARRLPARQVEGISNLADRLNLVDSRRTCSNPDLCFPYGLIHVLGQVDIAFDSVRLADVGMIA